MHQSRFFVGLAALLTLAACGDDTSGSGGSGGSGGAGTTSTTTSTGEGGATTTSATTTSTGQGGDGGMGGEGGAVPFTLSSPAFGEGDTMPMAHVCTNGGGDNESPVLSWTAGPPETQSYAIVMRDLDFQSGFIHWVIWDIQPNTLPAGIENVYQPSAPAGAKQAPFNNGLIGYLGPCSLNSVNTYQFTVHALDVATMPNLDDTSTKQEAAAAIEAASIASATLSVES